MKTWLFLLFIQVNLFAIPEYYLPEVVVIADKIVPIKTKERISGYNLIKDYKNEFNHNVLLLAAYINTQSRSGTIDDKYGIAKVILYNVNRKNMTLAEWLSKKSSTVYKKKSKTFWVDSNDKHSKDCIIAAYNTYLGNIPEQYDVGDAQGFLHEPSISNSVRKKWKPSKINKVFIHTFYRF